MEIEMCGDFENMDGPFFQTTLKTGVCFQHILKTYPLVQAQPRLDGASEGRTRVIFSKYLENRSLCFICVEKMESAQLRLLKESSFKQVRKLLA